RASAQTGAPPSGRAYAMHIHFTDGFQWRQIGRGIFVQLPRRNDRNRHTSLSEPKCEVRQHPAGCGFVGAEIAIYKDDLGAAQPAGRRDPCQHRTPPARNARRRIVRAGLPATMLKDSTSFVTTDRAPTTAARPTVTPGPMKASVPIQASSS